MVTPGLHVWPALYLSCYSVIFRQSQTTTSLLGVSQRGKNSTNLVQFHGRLWFRFISVSGSVNIYQYKIWFSDKILEIIISWTPPLASWWQTQRTRKLHSWIKKFLETGQRWDKRKALFQKFLSPLDIDYRARQDLSSTLETFNWHWGTIYYRKNLVNCLNNCQDDVGRVATVVDILSPAAMFNAYYICHNVQVGICPVSSCPHSEDWWR